MLYATLHVFDVLHWLVSFDASLLHACETCLAEYWANIEPFFAFEQSFSVKYCTIPRSLNRHSKAYIQGCIQGDKKKCMLLFCAIDYSMLFRYAKMAKGCIATQMTNKIAWIIGTNIVLDSHSSPRKQVGTQCRRHPKHSLVPCEPMGHLFALLLSSVGSFCCTVVLRFSPVCGASLSAARTKWELEACTWPCAWQPSWTLCRFDHIYPHIPWPDWTRPSVPLNFYLWMSPPNCLW